MREMKDSGVDWGDTRRLECRKDIVCIVYANYRWTTRNSRII